MLTLVMPNWQRTEQAQRIIAAQRNYPQIARIIVWNNNPNVRFEMEGVEAVNCTRPQSLFAQLAAAMLSQTDAVLLQDDDILIPPLTLTTLYEEWQRFPAVVHGTHGRIVGDGDYNTANQHGPVDLCLSRCVVVHRDLCRKALRYEPHLADIPRDVPGNGHDITLSWTARSRGLKNFAYDLPYENLEEPHAVSATPNHLAQRNAVLHRCRELMGDGAATTSAAQKRATDFHPVEGQNPRTTEVPINQPA